MDYVTQSQIGLNKTCPYKWMCYRLKIPTTPREEKFSIAGITIHQAIREYYQVIDENPLHTGVIEGTARQIFDRLWKGAGNSVKDMGDRKDRCLNNFIKFETRRYGKWQRFKPDMVEERLKAKINGYGYLTILDTFWIHDGILVDWKTGAKTTLDWIDLIQGHVEEMILKSMGFTVKKVLFECLLNGLEIQLPQVDDAMVEAEVAKMYATVEKGDFPKIKSPACLWCDWITKCSLDDRGLCIWLL